MSNYSQYSGFVSYEIEQDRQELRDNLRKYIAQLENMDAALLFDMAANSIGSKELINTLYELLLFKCSNHNEAISYLFEVESTIGSIRQQFMEINQANLKLSIPSPKQGQEIAVTQTNNAHAQNHSEAEIVF